MAKSKKRRKSGAVAASKSKPRPPEVSERLKRYAAALDLSETKTRPRLLSLVFCDFTNTTTEGKVNVLGIFDRVTIDPKLDIKPRFFVFGRFAETVEDVLWLSIFGPDNLPAAEVRFDPPSMKQLDRSPGKNIFYPQQIQFMLPVAMTFKKEGTYWFDVSYKGVSLGGAGLVVEYKSAGEKGSGTDTFV